MSKVKKFEHQGRFAVISKYRNHIIFYAIVGGLACAYTFLTFSMERMIMLIFVGLISILYTLPIFGKSMRLRDFSFIKIFLIAMVWSVVTESIPMYEVNASMWMIGVLFMERAAFFIAITIPFDMRDIDIDRTNNVKTIPNSIGKTKATYLALSLLVFCCSIEVYFWIADVDGSIAALLAYISTALLVIWVKEKKEDYYFSGLMDGTIMLPWLFLVLLG